MKIFCIGLNKTGTNSLHEAFKILGLKSAHFMDDEGRNIKDIIMDNHLNGRNILTGLEHYDAISDWDTQDTVEIFKKFDRHWPGSRFVLNFRDVGEWMDSRERHVENEIGINGKCSWSVDRDLWAKQHAHHYGEAIRYFEGRGDMLIMEVTKGDGWEKLCPFLGMKIPQVKFPHVRP